MNKERYTQCMLEILKLDIEDVILVSPPVESDETERDT